jgi:hypothetical protein
MRMEIVRSGRRRSALATHDLGLRRPRLPGRWRDETAYLLRDPANARLLLDSVAELDRWAAILDAPRERLRDDAA